MAKSYTSRGMKGGAPVVVAGGPGGGKAGIKAVRGPVTESPDKAASGSTPKGMSYYSNTKKIKG